jgi:DDE superfamily endonuclease
VRKFLRGFIRRQASVVRLGKTRKQEAVRFQATNADVLTTHAAALENLIAESGIDADRIFNLDECGETPGKYVSGQTKEKVFTKSGVRGDARMPSFANCSRVTIVPTISAAGSCCAPLFIFKGARLKSRVVSRNVGAAPAVELTEAIADLLPRKSIVTYREDVTGMDKAIFSQWARDFVKEVADLTSGGRKILLPYDGYRSHLAVEALEILVEAGIIVYALPTHTSGSTQRLDVAVFGTFKQALNDTIHSVSHTATAPVFDEFDFALMLKRAYEVAFKPDNIRAGFRRTGMWPIDPVALLRKPLPASANNTETVSVLELGHMWQAKREAAASELGVQQMVIRRGFLLTQSA